MIIFTNDMGEIRDIGITDDNTLQKWDVIEDDDFPFLGWSIAKMCCYRVDFTPEIITEIVDDVEEKRESGKYFISMYTPTVDSKIISHIERLGNGTEKVSLDVTDTQMALAETFEATLMATETATMNSDQLTDVQLALVDIYETMLGGL